MSVTYSGDGITFGDGSSITGGWTGFKNRVHNGSMVIDQRNSGSSINTNGGYPLDRFYTLQGTSGAFTAQQSSEAPTGFKNSLLFTVTTAGSSTASQQVRITQAFEGLNMYDLDWGKSTAKTVTVSFWVRSSLVGTYCVAIHNDGGNRAYIKEYTINSANTWEYKSVVIPGCTDGTWPTTSGRWGTLKFDLGSGSDRLGSAGSWLSGAEYAKTSNQVNFINNLNATFYLTGVQVELGSTASSFEYRPYGAELVLCQRYYEILYLQQWVAYRPTNSGSGQPQVGIQYMTKRTTPSITFTSPTIDGVGVTTTAAEQTLTNSRGYTSTTVAAGFLGEYDCTSGVKIDAEL